MSKNECVNIIARCGAEAKWAAETLARKAGYHPHLKALARVVQAGGSVDGVPYVMPYEMVCVNGVDVKTSSLV